MFNRLHLIEGSSLDTSVIDQVYEQVGDAKSVLVVLDSNHTHDHVLGELEAYAPLTSTGSYCVVFDTIVEDLPAGFFDNRPWDPGNSPRTAIDAFLAEIADVPRAAHDGKPMNFEVDAAMTDKLLLTAAPGGFLRRI